ncbi:MAG: GNAT family N-acetyltransferase [Patescibacteria group bacterium]
MSKLEIRPYTPTDSEAVIHLHNVALEAAGAHVGNGPWDSDLLNIKGVYLENNGAFLVGLLDGQIVAMGALRKISDEKGEIKRMRVLPQFQRQGFGQAILDVLEKEAVKKGYKTLCLDTTVLQVAAQKMYLKNGYAEVRRTKQGFPFETIFYEKRL